MARAALLRGTRQRRRHRFTPLSAIHFTGSLSLAQPVNTAALSGAEKFFEALDLTAPANAVLIAVSSAHYPGRASIADAAQGGLLALNDLPNGSLAAADAALYDVQITETV